MGVGKEDLRHVNEEYLFYARGLAQKDVAAACQILNVTRLRAKMYGELSIERVRLISTHLCVHITAVHDSAFRQLTETTNESLMAILPALSRAEAASG